MSSKRLFIGNLPLNTSEEALRSEFRSYGEIETVEIKNKKNAFDEETCFAFISMELDDRMLQQCIREFKEQKFNGNYVSVSLAKESFLDRLKREREGQGKDNAESKKIKVHVKHDFTANLNPRRQQQNVNYGEDMPANEYYDEPAEEETSKQPHSKTFESDRKRVESVKKLADLNKQKKNYIKSALANIDNSRNKIVFDDGEYQQPQQPQKRSTKEKSSSMALFNEDEEEDYNEDFKIKEQFQGVKGQKLLELQTRYKNDQRFQLDSRFKDGEYEDEQLNGNGDEIGSDDEREQQLKILENVVGKPLNRRNNITAGDPNQIKKSALMTRFDPTKNELQNLSSRRPGRKAEMHHDTKFENSAEPIVSQETFYKVSDTLKTALKSNETNGFSLLGMFGKVDDDDNDDSGIVNNYSYQTTMDKNNKIKKHKEKNPFKYDSSESEDEVDFKSATKEAAKTKTNELQRETFFYIENDQRLKDGAQFYRMVESTMEKTNYDDYRGELKKVVRKKFKKFQQKVGAKNSTFRRKKK